MVQRKTKANLDELLFHKTEEKIVQTYEMPNKHQSMNPELIPEYSVAVLGDGKVGKTCAIERFTLNTYSEDYTQTISEVYHAHLKRKDKPMANFKIFDTAGSINFPAMNRITISKSAACVVMFSVTSKDSLEHAARLLQEICVVRQQNRCPCVVVGSKNDVNRLEREVTFEQGVQFAVKYGCSYLEISAKNDVNIKDIFEIVYKKIKYLEAIQKEKSYSILKARALSFKSIFI